ncbi:MAG: HD domain-containing protein [Deltaproteobacteria bacterium]|uniref:HD domain-containing protein n=1 Tax=Candidatus Zymogenus saltonus TaxID=2844893 RepID=A0A9D8KFV2_9DELT|nr:HD domain-containing protein [Candidatus Zymogenus saltonus]
MVKISDIIRGQDIFEDKKQKGGLNSQGKDVAISDILTPDDILGEKISQYLRAPTEVEKKEALLILSELNELLDNMFSSMRKGEKFDIIPLSLHAKRLVNSIDKYQNIFMAQMYNSYDYTNLSYNSLWTTIIAIKIGRRIGMSGAELNELALAGLTHDVGLGLIPEDILSNEKELLRSEVREIESHPDKGSEFLKKFGNGYQHLSLIALQEHEREDGSGYPKGLTGKDIHQHAKIIGLADTYEAMTQDRPYRKRILPLYVMKDIVENMKGKYNSEIIKALLEEVTLFPVGSYVRLNSKEVGRVIAGTGETHFRQIVQILYDSDGKKLKTPKIVNLMEAHLIHIVEPVDENQLEG